MFFHSLTVEGQLENIEISLNANLEKANSMILLYRKIRASDEEKPAAHMFKQKTEQQQQQQ